MFIIIVEMGAGQGLQSKNENVTVNNKSGATIRITDADGNTTKVNLRWIIVRRFRHSGPVRYDGGRSF